MKPSPIKLYGLVSLMTLIWGVNYVVAKIGLRYFPAALFATMRMIVAGAVMVPVYVCWRRRRLNNTSLTWTPNEVAFLCFMGLFGIVGNQIFFVMGMGKTSVAHASLIIATAPVQVLAMAWARGQERLTRLKVLGMMLAVGGIALLNLAPARPVRGATLWGDFLVFCCAFSFAVYTVFSKDSAARHGAIPINTLGYVFSALVLAGPVGWLGDGYNFEDVSWIGWSMLAYMALLSSVLCYIIYAYALKHMPASRVASFSYAQPVIASLSGFLVLGEPVTLPVVAGGALVLSGVWLTGAG